MNETLREAKELHALGFALHWLKPKSKAPVNSKWTTGERLSWDELQSTYKQGYNIGVRLGTPSKIGDNYLAVIDLDIKSDGQRHLIEATSNLAKLFPTIDYNTPKVISGRGNGSGHLYILTPTPAAPIKLAQSTDLVKVHMPSTPIPKNHPGLSYADVEAGFRMRPAWEICVMGEGQQVVLPPSIHPDTGNKYVWAQRVLGVDYLIPVTLPGKEKSITREATSDWTPESVDIIFSSLPKPIIDLLVDGECDDRSAALLTCAIAMVRHDFTDRAIMSVLTDTTLSLGNVAYEHAQTKSRARAANWILNYTIKKARESADATKQFKEDVVVEELDPVDAIKQAVELSGKSDWKDLIERYKGNGANSGKPKPTLENVILILTNAVSESVVRRNVFAFREAYSIDTPWGGEKDHALEDIDTIKIVYWLARFYRFEPPKGMVDDALGYIAAHNSYDPIKDWLEALPLWDGNPRLDTWLKEHFEAKGEPEYLAQVFRKWMCAMVIRTYHPGAKFDWMPVFQGTQGIGKSSFGRLLVGDEYFLDALSDLSDKDSALGLQGIWAVEMGELASLNRAALEMQKAYITRQIDKVRPPYGRKWIESKRRCVFFGTTNQHEYLHDKTGNRRFKPLRVGALDFKALIRDREQLFAEALFLYRNEFETEHTLYLTGKAKEQEFEAQENSMVEDESSVFREKILDHIDAIKKAPENEAFNYNKFSLLQLTEMGGPLPDLKLDSRRIRFLAEALRSLGGKNWKSRGRKVWQIPTGGHPEGSQGTPKNDQSPKKTSNNSYN